MKRAGATRGLLSALGRSAEAAGCPIEPLEDDFTAWSSVAFSGGRHLLKFGAARSDALDTWLETLPGAETAISDHLVAELKVIAVKRLADFVEFHLEVLTVEERVAA